MNVQRQDADGRWVEATPWLEENRRFLRRQRIQKRVFLTVLVIAALWFLLSPVIVWWLHAS